MGAIKSIISVGCVSLGLFLGTPAWGAEEVQDPREARAQWEAKFQEGMEALEEDRVGAAIRAFNGLLAMNPRLHRARLELAVAYYRAMQFDEAMRLGREVLADPDTPPDVRPTIRAFLAEVERQKALYEVRHEFRPRVSLGFMYDTNVNVGPSSEYIEIDGRLLRIISGLRQEDAAMTLEAGVTHRYNPQRTFMVGDRIGSVEWLSQAGFYQRGYRDEKDYDLGVLYLSTGPAWTVLHHWRAALNVEFDRIWLGGNRLAWFGGLRPFVSWQIGRGEVTLDASFTRREYDRDLDRGREGNYRSAGLALGRHLLRGKAAGQIGLRWFDFRARTDRFGNEGWEVYLGGLYSRVGRANDLYARLTYKDLDYDGAEPLFGVARDEREKRAVVGLWHRFRSDAWHGWAWNLSFSYTDNDSNIPIYDYDRREIMWTINKVW